MRLLYIVTEDWYFLSHRLPMARAARDAGFEVHVATRVADGAAAIRAEGFHLQPVPFARGRLSLSGAWRTVRALRRIHREVEPALVHRVSLQATVLGLVAARGRPPGVNALTGLGYSFISEGIRAKLLRLPLRVLLRTWLNQPSQTVLVQNADDRADMIALGIDGERIALIAGSGVDIERLTPLPEPPQPITVAFVGRLLADKGIPMLVAAHRLLRKRGRAVQLLIAGTPDSANPASLTEREANDLNQEPGIQWLGHVDDIASFWARAHIAVLPSRREGLPKSLLEAAACGRPMIATDVPGCREIVRPGETGLLVPDGDVPALADAIDKLAASAALRARYGTAARALVVEQFSDRAIGRQTVDLYRRLMGGAVRHDGHW